MRNRSKTTHLIDGSETRRGDTGKATSLPHSINRRIVQNTYIAYLL